LLSKPFLAHELDDTSIISRVWLQRGEDLLLRVALEQHEWRRIAVVGSRRPRASIDLEDGDHRSLANIGRTANPHGRAVRKDSVIEYPIHNDIKVNEAVAVRNATNR
jgi:hypothetical protein